VYAYDMHAMAAMAAQSPRSLQAGRCCWTGTIWYAALLMYLCLFCLTGWTAAQRLTAYHDLALLAMFYPGYVSQVHLYSTALVHSWCRQTVEHLGGL
jgi:hypothetical protein